MQSHPPKNPKIKKKDVKWGSGEGIALMNAWKLKPVPGQVRNTFSTEKEGFTSPDP